METTDKSSPGEHGVPVSPWSPTEPRRFLTDDQALVSVLSGPIAAKAKSQSGALARAFDVWLAGELRRAGFDPDAVWPRAFPPRVLPREVATLLRAAPPAGKTLLNEMITRSPSVTPNDAKILGRAYVKQVDVVMSSWNAGPEVLISTKTMVSSFGKNLASRFEEAYGDAKNLRGRHPLAAIGFAFLLRSTALAEPVPLHRALDMLRKLKAEFDVYDATCLVVAEWPDDGSSVLLLPEAVPDDLSAGAFLTGMVDAVLSRSPISMHVAARRLREGDQSIPISDESDAD